MRCELVEIGAATAEDLELIAAQLECHRQRLEFWYGRHAELAGIVLDEKNPLIHRRGATARLPPRDYTDLVQFPPEAGNVDPQLFVHPDRRSSVGPARTTGHAQAGTQRRSAERVHILDTTRCCQSWTHRQSPFARIRARHRLTRTAHQLHFDSAGSCQARSTSCRATMCRFGCDSRARSNWYYASGSPADSAFCTVSLLHSARSMPRSQSSDGLAQPATACNRPADERRIAVVLLTYNCARWVERTLHHHLALEGNPRIIAVDNGSSDATVDLLRRHASIDVVRRPRNIGAAARNAGVKRATTPYVAFSDDDTWDDTW